jgi:hypothetical protein
MPTPSIIKIGIPMKNIFLLLLCSISIHSLAQDTTYRKLPDTRVNMPLCIINSRIIGWVDILNPDSIKNVNVYKDNQTPKNLKNLGQYGIVIISTSQYIKTKTFSEIKNWLDLEGNIKFAIDGFFVDDESLLIATNSINEINVIKNPTEIVVNIWTLPTGRRKGEIVPHPQTSLDIIPQFPPGTIYIRGSK